MRAGASSQPNAALHIYLRKVQTVLEINHLYTAVYFIIVEVVVCLNVSQLQKPSNLNIYSPSYQNE